MPSGVPEFTSRISAMSRTESPKDPNYKPPNKKSEKNKIVTTIRLVDALKPKR